MLSPTLVRESRDGLYPSEADDFMPNIEWHNVLLGRLLQALQWFYREAARVVVTGDIFVYHGRGVRTCVGPDLFLSLNAERRLRRRWLTWEDGALDLVIELLSESSAADDQGTKLTHYRDTLRVREYFLFDPEGGLMNPRLRGYRHDGTTYQEIEAVDGRLPSAVTGLHLERDGDELRFWNPATRGWLPTEAERIQQLEEELRRRGLPIPPA